MGRESASVSRTSVANVAISAPQFLGVVLGSASSTVSMNFANMSCIGMA